MSRSAEQLLRAAREWIDGDPDPGTRLELETLITQGDFAELELRLSPIGFGTAGLRARVGAGSGYMNRAVVIRTASGIARYLLAQAQAPESPVVIGFDARPTSRVFAEVSAGVLLAAGLPVLAFPEPVATPLVAFTARELGARLAIVVTASHNPRADNGYKVYGPDAVQIAAPVDVAIAREIALALPARQVPRYDVDFADKAPPHAALTLASAELQDRYFQALARALPAGRVGRALRIAYSALHGVGWAPVKRALGEAGFSVLHAVSEQSTPDGSFPTTPFPNPEEPDTLDLSLALGERMNAELVLVNDPDADRLAAAARFDGELVALDGNQLGALLADHALSMYRGRGKPLILTSVVSSPLVEQLALARGARHERTLTGFKWLWRAALALEDAGAGSFCFGYEEALGYSIFSGVRDKDGISAARALAELAASLNERQQTLFDRLFELYREYGLWVSAARNVPLARAGAGHGLDLLLDQLVDRPPLELSGQRVERVLDYRRQAEQRPAWLGRAALVELGLQSGERLFIRPSGTEPKLKLYAHVRRNASKRSELGASLEAARASAAALLQNLEASLDL